ncbi:MAG TPA: UDP-N-acetylmuramoyl-tripeptide--D-alanyl-D-alanine ligase [Candidatus Limnocylindrales bacterium]|nr:UDP-N-acetylmuramoyl-tripeptide--D-alanyl-D-alanine ligase [Candidatus Limnocylindrales bacterium]
MKIKKRQNKELQRYRDTRARGYRNAETREYGDIKMDPVSLRPRVSVSQKPRVSTGMARLIDNILTATQGRLLQELKTGEPDGFSIDSRTLKPGQVFIALIGERFNGHDFILEALQKGAKGVILSDETSFHRLQREALNPDFFVIQVEDTLRALQNLAHFYRMQYRHIPLIGVTGSNGKTTVKEMIASILSQRYITLKSQGNWNNLIGLPLSLLSLTDAHGAGVLEMGMSKAGEIKRLAEIAEPDVGIITNISGAHLEFFDSIEAIMKAKVELIQSLPLNGVAVLNADDTFFPSMVQEVRCKLITFGINWEANVSATDIILSENKTYTFNLRINGGKCSITLPVMGYHNIYNALAAAAATHALGLNLSEIQRGLENFQSAPMRMETISHKGILILNDAYNANPSSMKMALKTLKEIPGVGRKIAVLGDMLELGRWSEMAHKGVGEAVADLGIDLLWVLGPYSQFIALGAREKGMEPNRIFLADSHEQIIEKLQHELKEGDTVLIKGSRGMKMEKIVKGLITTH